MKYSEHFFSKLRFLCLVGAGRNIFPVPRIKIGFRTEIKSAQILKLQAQNHFIVNDIIYLFINKILAEKKWKYCFGREGAASEMYVGFAKDKYDPSDIFVSSIMGPLHGLPVSK